MEPWLIVVIVFASIFGTYLLICLFSVFRIFHFRRALKMRLIALSAILSEERSALDVLVVTYREAGFLGEESDALAISSLAPIAGILRDEAKVKSLQESIMSLLRRIESFEGKGLSSAQRNENEAIFARLEDLVANYRRIAALYNRELIGYEYWRRHPIWRWPFSLGFRERKRLV